jgi:hypothetical protein
VADRFVIANFPMYVNHNSFDLNMDKWFRGQSIDRITCNGQNEMELEDKHAAQNLESKPTICYSSRVYMVNHDGFLA